MFRVGQTVKCIDPGSTGNGLVAGDLYTFLGPSHFNQDRLGEFFHIDTGEVRHAFYTRFKVSAIQMVPAEGTVDELIREFGDDLRKAVEAGTMVDASYTGVFAHFLLRYNNLKDNS